MRVEKKMKVEELRKEIKKYTEELNNIYDSSADYPHEPNNPEYEHSPDHVEILEDQLSRLELELREYEYTDEAVQRSIEIDDLIFNEGYIIRDSESTNDLLSRAEQALEISKLISNKKTLSPLTLGIYGPWGEGKSSFLRLIETELDNINVNIKNDYKDVKNKYNKTHVVRFDASEYNDQDKIWFSMLSQLFAKYEKEVGIRARIKYGSQVLKVSYRENKWNYIINFILLSAFIAWVVIFTKDKSIVQVIKDNALYTNILGLISTAAVATNIVMPILKKIKSFSKPMSEKIISQLKYPDYKGLLGTREKVKESLDALIEAWTKKRGDKIVIMVDELDRCSEKTIVEFFDALQLFLPVESIIHVISINQEAVCYSLANNNSHFFDKEIVSNSEKLTFGQKYLEKYISIPYHLPKEYYYKDYITCLLNGQLNLYGESETDILVQSINDITKYKHITPREMKKIINLLLLSKERLINIYKSKDYIHHIPKFDEYISWFLLKYFYPKSAEIIIDYLEKYSDYNKYKTYNQIKDIIHNIKDFQENPNIKESEILLKKLDNIRIEYIIISNEISESLIYKTQI
ncbi:KAP family P-loop NTPase fold protein [Peribacillus simplex]|uniref:KAP NTPase domain-containing protein n=1 Tax=Peribacillus simplex TaxID=1478 RepID=A0A9W4L3S6_9BACI|nr:P-loop NTPase fold protein [Peribacillus simplex]CAH0289900.1 hypothetical protein SRABI133_04201 [Peribacillus simplex]